LALPYPEDALLYSEDVLDPEDAFDYPEDEEPSVTR
jgi:hypothetical protein